MQSDVVLQTSRSGEALVAFRTLKLLPTVELLVLPKASRLVEGAWAVFAVVRSLSGVGEAVAVQRPGVGEAPATVRTVEGAFTGVHLHVARQLASLGELLATEGALVGLLSGVDAHVDLQGGHLVAVSSAKTTDEALGLVLLRLLLWSLRRTHFFFRDIRM